MALEQDSERTRAHLDHPQQEALILRALKCGSERLNFRLYALRVRNDLSWTRLHTLGIDVACNEPMPPGKRGTMPPPERLREQHEGDPTFDSSL